jgi:hypothetical protein
MGTDKKKQSRAVLGQAKQRFRTRLYDKRACRHACFRIAPFASRMPRLGGGAAEDGWLIAEGAKLVPSSATGKALVAGRSTPEGTGLRLACQAGRCFGKASASSLASVFSKHLRHSCNESALGFSGQQTGSSSSVVIREIRG